MREHHRVCARTCNIVSVARKLVAARLAERGEQFINGTRLIYPLEKQAMREQAKEGRYAFILKMIIPLVIGLSVLVKVSIRAAARRQAGG